jgi:replicative DNA helicase
LAVDRRNESAGDAGADRIPPQDFDAEQAVLGSILLESEAAARAFAIVTPDDFYRTYHKQICAAMVTVNNRNEPVDLVTVSAELRRNGQLEEVGGGEYLTALIGEVPTAAHVTRYANIVAEKAVLRRLINAGSQIQGLAYENPEDVGETLDRAEQIIFEIASRRMSGDFTHIEPLIEETVAKLDAAMTRKGSLTGAPTAITEFNKLTSGLQPGDLIIVAGRPSMGKTSFAINSLGLHAALHGGMAVAMFSLEMSKMQLAEMMLCGLARVNSWRLRAGLAPQDDWDRIGSALSYLPQAPIYIDDTPAISILELRSKARRLHAQVPLGLIVIDYLQLCTAPGMSSDGNRHQEIGHIARSLKSLARELQVPVVALSQLSRNVERREDKRPILSDLAESGSIEAEADIICFLYRPSYYQRKKLIEEAASRGEAPADDLAANLDMPDEAEIIVAKHRNGPVATILSKFDAKYRLFTNIDAYREGNY